MGDIKIASDALVCDQATLQVSWTRVPLCLQVPISALSVCTEGRIEIGSGTVVHPRCQLISERVSVIPTRDQVPHVASSPLSF